MILINGSCFIFSLFCCCCCWFVGPRRDDEEFEFESLEKFAALAFNFDDSIPLVEWVCLLEAIDADEGMYDCIDVDEDQLVDDVTTDWASILMTKYFKYSELFALLFDFTPASVSE